MGIGMSLHFVDRVSYHEPELLRILMVFFWEAYVTKYSPFSP